MNTDSKMIAAGLLMGIIGAVIAIEFLSVDALLFNTTAPPWIQTLSNDIPLNGLDLDILLTIDILLLIAEFHWQGER